MRFQHQGMSLWYSTSDAPAPGGTVPEGAELLVTVGVLPADASNRVEVRYRANQGAVQTVSATWFRNEASSGAQYFAARLPAFRAGDRVEFQAIATCAGRSVPSPEDAAASASSFQVVRSTARAMPPLPTGGAGPGPAVSHLAPQPLAPAGADLPGGLEAPEERARRAVAGLPVDLHRPGLDDRIVRPWWDEGSPPWWAPDASSWTYRQLADAQQRPTCQESLDGLRAQVSAPPPEGYGPGQLAAPLLVGEPLFVCLLRAALAQGEAQRGWFVWQNLDSELAVHHRESRAALLEGLVLVGLPTRCDQIPSPAPADSELVVPLAVGSPAEPAGLVMAAEPVARGPQLLVDVWGETAVAAAWLALVDVCRFLAELAGQDRNCYPLLPGAVAAQPGMFTVVPQARHAIDVRARL
jgi:hypothetical protein